MVFIYIFLVAISMLFFLAFVLFIIFQIIAEFTTDAPFVTIPSHMNNVLTTTFGLTSNSVLYDLGCGDARVLIQAVTRHHNIKAIGVERSMFPFLLAKFKTRIYKNITIRREDVFTTNISNATHIFVYLYPAVINALLPKFHAECKKGTVIISCDFEFANMLPDNTIIVNTESKRGKKILLYVI